MKRGHLQTMSVAFEQICAGERDWTALGNFMNYWYDYAKDRREALVADPLPLYDERSLHQHRWAVFCAASVEWFCNKYCVPCPEWVHDPKYILSEPWFFIFMSLLNPGFCKRHRRSLSDGMYFVGIIALLISGNWLNSYSNVSPLAGV
jgi:hypothetical protein